MVSLPVAMAMAPGTAFAGGRDIVHGVTDHHGVLAREGTAVLGLGSALGDGNELRALAVIFAVGADLEVDGRYLNRRPAA